VVVGRVEELAALHAVVDAARGGLSGTLLLRGEPGIGKTCLLDSIADSAGDLQVARIEGIESEMQLGYAALHRLLRPFLDKLEVLPGPQRDALGSAFGLTSTPAADLFMVGLAALTLLADAATKTPLVIVVDDAQWLDNDSIAALVFVARRLHADQIALIFAVRDAPEVAGQFKGLPDLQLVGLDELAARTFLRSIVNGPITFQVAGRIIEATGANPLALMELSGELTAEHLLEVSALPDPLPTGRLIEERFLRQIRLLPSATQLLLLIIAADTNTDPFELRRAAEELSISIDATEPAEVAGLLRVHPDVEFRHPLIRSAVYFGAPVSDRRRVHSALASAIASDSDVDRRTSHLALAAPGPDEDIAQQLEHCAIQARSRGGYMAETSFLVRSSEMTPDTARRGERLLAATECARLTGNTQYAQSLLENARKYLSGPRQSALAQRQEALLGTALGENASAPALLLSAAEGIDPYDQKLSREILLEALEAYSISAHLTLATTGPDIAAAASKALQVQETPPTTSDLQLKGLAILIGDNYAEAVTPLREAEAASYADELRGDNRNDFTTRSLSAIELYDGQMWQQALTQLAKSARRRGALFDLQKILLGLASYETRAGQFAAAESFYDDLQDVTIAVGGFPEFYALLNVELLSWQGDEERTRVATQALFDISSQMSGQGPGIFMSQLALARLHLAQGRYEEALVLTQAVADANCPGWSCQAFSDLIEASSRTDERAAGLSILDLLNQRATACGTAWALGLAARSAAVMEVGDPETLYEDAVAHLSSTPWTTEVARTHLVYGEWLRRQKRRVDARQQLRTAFEMFDTMGARAFGERARIELLATGERSRSRQIDATHDLTNRELQVARLAAGRATSREIAAQLFISVHTVEYHLRKVFQKFGITSRRDLSSHLPVEEGTQPWR